MNTPRALIVADDLTGAADTAVAFAAHGMPASVSLEGALPGTVVTSLDTDTRCATPERAAAAVYAAVSRARAAGVEMLYKKVDSTLRGNVAAELAAFAKASGDALCLFAPAFPATGRSTRDGIALVEGRPLSQTEMWRLARRTPPEDILALLAPSGLKVANVHLPDVRANSAHLAARFETARAAGTQVVICDAETDEDLASIARAGRLLQGRVIWAGSGGLAAQIAAQLPVTGQTPAREPTTARGRALVVVGSASERAHAQANALVDAGLRRVTIDASALLADRKHSLDGSAKELADTLSGGDTLVTLAYGDFIIEQRHTARETVTALAALLVPSLPKADTLVITGGETARALLTAAGATRFELLGELEAGVVHAHADGPDRPWTIVTKAGAFGDAGVLVRALQTLDSRSKERKA